jgi:hypothetical protein
MFTLFFLRIVALLMGKDWYNRRLLETHWKNAYYHFHKFRDGEEALPQIEADPRSITFPHPDLPDIQISLREYNVLMEYRTKLAAAQKPPGIRGPCIPRDGEPHFLLLARDYSAATMVRQWAYERQRAIMSGFKPATDMTDVIEARKIADDMERYRKDNNLVNHATRIRQPEVRRPVDEQGTATL